MIAPDVNYTNNQISNPIIFYVIAIMGCMGLYFLSVAFQQIKSIRFLGKKTLHVLVMHKFPIVFFQVIYPFSGLLKKPDTVIGTLTGVAVSIISIILCLMAGFFVEKYFPILFGKKLSVISEH